MIEPDRSGHKTVEVVLVTAPRCHFCDDASRLLEDLGSQYPLTVREVELESDEGITLARRFRVPFPPVLLIDDSYFGHGRISRRRLAKVLDEIVGAEASP